MARGEITGKKRAATADVKRRRPPRADAKANEPTNDDPKKDGSAAALCADPKAIEPTLHSELKEDIGTNTSPLRGPPLAFSIKQFCQLHAISRELFFKARREGWGPKIMKCGSRTLVSVEAAAEWRRQREEVATAAAAAA